ncbi:nitrate- and nitrite sensing domain-containing protein [Streptomyces sp. SP17BM10]|uniref:sensor histidine kinase n=1 Tax=Streptomyces sp. SP17BM10 TaxID=3002530 RepID=UPI002E77DFE1|nr:nitrate- and nitrite sensing domain-containing protein [Streptomyces sp. SP17BM10]MEE1787464.1 nitrate- and nitrite sensing domain-containing protein [Streptomyces sp. SP17BM10]
MRLRSSSIRAKIIALLLVPIVALTALWVYATIATTGDVWSQLELSRTYKEFGTPADQYATDLQNERRAAVQRLADPGSRAARDAYDRAKADTDRDLGVLRDKKDSIGGRLSAAQRGRLLQILAAADQMGPLRAQVGRSALNWEFALDQYSDLIKPVFGFRSAFVARQSGQLPRQGTILIELVRAREYLAQEDAAMEGLRTGTARPTAEQYQTALDALHNQQALYTVYIAELEPADQADYIALRGGDAWAALVRAEADFVGAGGPANVAQAINGDSWRETADRALGDLAAVNSRIADGIAERERSYATGLLWRGGIAGAVGLVAIVLTVLISFRIGRGLARELIGLRNAANELATTRLPAVMRRLRRGEAVDVAAEAPELRFGQAEIGQVGQAFNAVQRAAVEAAVEQAELRRGVSAVFVNLARRSQVLLHRQLTLLDTMERRTEDPAELEDLFKVDHLTTRMRRHAEGLIILAGGSPGRAWRKPVRMVDVVRAAVGEVEDYARVTVRPLPGTGLLGSAVADVTHLVAELVENAAVFSPPNTQVTVQGEVVAHGFALEIDDRGLGLSGPALAEINERLAVEQEFDLADTDRLGLFVVSRLARRHGIRVHLRPSPYGGTTAVVLVPRELLAEATDGPAEPSQAGRRPAATVRRGQRDLVAVPGGAGPSGPAPEVSVPGPEGGTSGAAVSAARGSGGGRHRGTGGPRPSAAEPARTPGGLPRRVSRTKGGPVLVPPPGGEEGGSDGTGRHRRAEILPAAGAAGAGPADLVLVESPAAAQTPVAPAAPPVLGEQAASGARTPGGLPRRVRQANLAPQLKEQMKERLRSGRADDARSSGDPVVRAAQEAERAARETERARERSPEEARATFASFQRGFTRGRGATGSSSSAAPPSVGPTSVGPSGPTGQPTATPVARPSVASVPVWQPPDTSRRAISPAPAPAALPAPSDGSPAPLARRLPAGPPVRLVPPPGSADHSGPADHPGPAGASGVSGSSGSSGGPGADAQGSPARPVRHVRPIRPAPSAPPAPPVTPAPAEGTDS